MRAMALIDAYRFVYVPDDEDKRVHKGTQQPKEEAVADKAEADAFVEKYPFVTVTDANAAKVAAYKDAWNALSADAKKYIDKDYEALIAEAEQLLVRPVLTYQTHVQNIGWQSWVRDGALAGTSGKSLRLEAMNIRLTGELEQYYHVEYRTHVQNIGWQSWVRDGAMAGTSGKSLRLEALQIRLVRK